MQKLICRSSFCNQKSPAVLSRENLFLKLPKTKYNPRFHATKKELELLPLITTNIYSSQLNDPERKQVVLFPYLRQIFVLHESPLSVHSELHLGHFYNKIAKDIVKRYKLLRGFKVFASQGFDCFGSSIEHAAIQEIVNRDKKIRFLEYDENQIRKLCKEYVIKQSQDYFKSIHRWGLLLDPGETYFTLQNSYISGVFSVFSKILENNQLFEQHKTIFWSISRQAQVDLDEIDIKYVEQQATFLKIPLSKQSLKGTAFELINKTINLVVFTSQPWTLTGMKCLALNPDLDYEAFEDEKNIYIGSKPFMNKHLKFQFRGNIRGHELESFTCKHPIYGNQIQIALNPSLSGRIGSGIQPLCPAHYLDDLEIAQQLNIPKRGFVDENGDLNDVSLPARLLDKNVPNGEANKEIIALLSLREQNLILDILDSVSSVECFHKISGEKLILRTEPHFFFKISPKDEGQFLSEIDSTATLKIGKCESFSDFRETIKNKREWCISTKAAWGIPIPLFKVEHIRSLKKANILASSISQLYQYNELVQSEDHSTYLINSDIIQHLIGLIEKHGFEVWWQWEPQELLPEKHKSLAKFVSKVTHLVFDDKFVQGYSSICIHYQDVPGIIF